MNTYHTLTAYIDGNGQQALCFLVRIAPNCSYIENASGQCGRREWKTFWMIISDWMQKMLLPAHAFYLFVRSFVLACFFSSFCFACSPLLSHIVNKSSRAAIFALSLACVCVCVCTHCFGKEIMYTNRNLHQNKWRWVHYNSAIAVLHCCDNL